MEEELLRIRRFEEIPSEEEFATQIEPKNVPAVFIGCTKTWKAFSRWNPSNGGLDYLQGQAGSSVVEAMLSRSAPVFYGDIRSHERVPLPFFTFIGYCKELLNKDGHKACSESEEGLPVPGVEQDNFLCGDAPQRVYLAQVPILNVENEERVQLQSLRDDIHTPPFLVRKVLASLNLWMNGHQTRSSTHYDPHNNLLCVVTGCKQVVLWPPSASPFLYPMPLYGEASNHSSVSLEKPDLFVHPRAKHSTVYSQKVTLHAGDALFIPEGWFHQVDSDDLTIAVNFWWRSTMLSGMSEHMDAYYLRRIVKRMTDKEMNHMLHKGCTSVGDFVANMFCRPDNGKTGPCVHNYESKGLEENKKQKILLNELEPLALQSLHELVSLVHTHINVADHCQPVESASINNSSIGEKVDVNKTVLPDKFYLEDDPVANILWSIPPPTLKNIFLVMAHNFPRTLEGLILHMLSPVGAEVLTRKFDEICQVTCEEDRNEFYSIFYGVFDNQFAAMDTLLNAKEVFAFQAFKNVLDQYLGIQLDGPK